jgi:hypothetical protein
MIHVKRFAIGIIVVLGLVIVLFGIPYGVGCLLHRIFPERTAVGDGMIITIGEGMIITYVIILLLGVVYGVGRAMLGDSPQERGY